MAEAVSGRGKDLGLTACTARVVGSMVGSGFYQAPSAMAPNGLLAIRRIATGAGAVCLGLLVTRPARLTRARGGPYANAGARTAITPGFSLPGATRVAP